jgi:tRNA-modifying protein YgfZ
MDLSARGKIRVLGEDRARLLHAMTTQDLQSLTRGHGCLRFLPECAGPHPGRRESVSAARIAFLLDTEPETRQKLFDHIDRYIIADDVTLEDATGEMATIAIEGPHAAAVLERLGAPSA